MKLTHPLTVLLICSGILIASSYVWVSSGPNSYNPNFDYPEVFDVDPSDSNITYKGELKTGYITIKEQESKIFYVLYSAGGDTNPDATINNTAPLILWLQGGPGCGDGTGNYNEIGPFKIVKNSEGKLVTELKDVNWNDEYNLLFVDSPVGVGYSVTGGDLPTSAIEAAEDLQVFLIRFFQVYPNLLENDFYVFGESYGGHYIPALATTIVQNITENKINLKGIGVGNGCTDPYTQVASFADLTFSFGLLDEKTRDAVVQIEENARSSIASGDYKEGTSLFDKAVRTITEANDNIDVYNFEIYNEDPSMNYYVDWLNFNKTKAAYGVDPNVTYLDCVGKVESSFANDITASYLSNYSYLLTQTELPDLKIIIYGGQNDIMCNNLGVLNYIKQIEWDGSEGFINSKKQLFKTSDGVVEGNYKLYKNLNFAVIYDAGHMSPLDQPNSARDMLENYMKNKF